MKALTGYPMWFGLVAAGIKLIENRPQQLISPREFGKPFALHHGALPKLKIRTEIMADIRRIDPSLFSGLHEGRQETWPPWYRLAWTTSAITAVSSVERCVARQVTGEIRDIHTMEVVDLGEQECWFFGPYGYVFAPPTRLRIPVPAGGHQWFWTLDQATEQHVLRESST